MAKPKISTDWMCGCAGCHMSLLDMDERILQVVELADLRFISTNRPEGT